MSVVEKYFSYSNGREIFRVVYHSYNEKKSTMADSNATLLRSISSRLLQLFLEALLLGTAAQKLSLLNTQNSFTIEKGVVPGWISFCSML